MINVITFGTFDLFHYGHLRILERAKEYGDNLIVGVSSDELNFTKKQRYPLIHEKQRMHIINSLKCVNKVFLEESLELKEEYILKYKANILIMGNDWQGKFDHLKHIADIIYLPRTINISTTDIINRIKEEY
ncbi:adenylyltransferase/cytidyltransferase family protein [Campylobacter lari]|uniref:adenylyltransferase/cytidyltransferase family protein n=1 Tax=Campylobacter lari TaxID=201 RepID=UPI0011EAD337|nr:adenylyltransferase/cytidyltransferase family protein [Campylobacter lari]EAH8848321.1 glycerol-3-phosphate cytidylyltransferase [Campylobacter lari]EHS0799671.1 adenylyltransferase/cytidyltransferase family protein [Campylobacter lari]KAB0589882.1 adenylyltransferase/cytidyltransferase family protein [Campylobacter lari subsp. concheus]MCV3431276.1 adenylyltransferase/cytidyltransferase family protein [Campylobacter lari]MPC01112.1 adenylyltransferase/cytidyltransferase family protein [Cam